MRQSKQVHGSATARGESEEFALNLLINDSSTWPDELSERWQARKGMHAVSLKRSG